MNSDPNDFETLRKLMALKRHEQPPPEYLDRLPERIINRIEHGEGRLSLWDRVSANFALRPTVAYAFGLTVCGALGLSAVYLVRQQAATASGGVALRIPASTAAALAREERQQETPPLHVANWLGNTNPTVDYQFATSLFGPNHGPAPVSVSYETGR
jgi:hypothetical protein